MFNIGEYYAKRVINILEKSLPKDFPQENVVREQLSDIFRDIQPWIQDFNEAKLQDPRLSKLIDSRLVTIKKNMSSDLSKQIGYINKVYSNNIYSCSLPPCKDPLITATFFHIFRQRGIEELMNRGLIDQLIWKNNNQEHDKVPISLTSEDVAKKVELFQKAQKNSENATVMSSSTSESFSNFVIQELKKMVTENFPKDDEELRGRSFVIQNLIVLQTQKIVESINPLLSDLETSKQQDPRLEKLIDQQIRIIKNNQSYDLDFGKKINLFNSVYFENVKPFNEPLITAIFFKIFRQCGIQELVTSELTMESPKLQEFLSQITDQLNGKQVEKPISFSSEEFQHIETTQNVEKKEEPRPKDPGFMSVEELQLHLLNQLKKY